MMNYFDKLPEDLQDNIYSLIKYPQDKDLILDIKTFHIVKQTIYSDYLSKCLDIYTDYNSRFDILFYKKINEKKMNRMLSYRIKYNLYNEKASFNFNNKSCHKTYINKYIGCLNVDERGELLSHLNELIDADF